MKRSLVWIMFFLIPAAFLTGCSPQEHYANALLPGQTVTLDEVNSRMRVVLREGLQSRDPASRCHVLEVLSMLKDDGSKRMIRESLYDSSPAVRVSAALAAGDARDSMAQTALHTLLRENYVPVQLAAAYALECLGDKRFGSWYDNVLMGEDAQLSGLACMILGKLGTSEVRLDSGEKLWKVLKKENQNPQVRLQAAESLAKLGDETILERLLAYAGSTFADDRILALSGLAELDKRGNANAYAGLVMLAGDPQIEVKLAAYKALGNRNDQTNIEEVRKSVMWTDPTGDALAAARVRGLALMTLGHLGWDADLPRIYQAMHHPTPYVRLSAAWAAADFVTRQGSSRQGI